jgi:hypothetical protein
MTPTKIISHRGNLEGPSNTGNYFPGIKKDMEKYPWLSFEIDVLRSHKITNRDIFDNRYNPSKWEMNGEQIRLEYPFKEGESIFILGHKHEVSFVPLKDLISNRFWLHVKNVCPGEAPSVFNMLYMEINTDGDDPYIFCHEDDPFALTTHGVFWMHYEFVEKNWESLLNKSPDVLKTDTILVLPEKLNLPYHTLNKVLNSFWGVCTDYPLAYNKLLNGVTE